MSKISISLAHSNRNLDFEKRLKKEMQHLHIWKDVISIRDDAGFIPTDKSQLTIQLISNVRRIAKNGTENEKHRLVLAALRVASSKLLAVMYLAQWEELHCQILRSLSSLAYKAELEPRDVNSLLDQALLNLELLKNRRE